MNPKFYLSPTTRSWFLVVAFFGAIVAFWFSPVWLGGRLLAPMDILHELIQPWRGDTIHPKVHNHFVSDAVTQYIPYRIFAEESFRKDGYIGWNPYVLGGTPAYANTMATPNDWTMQLHRWLPFWTAWHLGIAGQFLLAGLGMIVFLRSQGVSPPIALLGAIAFAGASPFVVWIYHRWALGSFCWLPWLLWALTRWRNGNPRFWTPACLFLALSLVGGTLQHATFIFTGIGCVWLAWMIESRGQWSAQARITVLLALCGILGVGLAAFSFLPATRGFLENLAGGHQGRGGLGYPEGVFQPLFNAISYLAYPFPWPLGSPQSLDLWKVFRSDLFNVCYFGFLPTALSLILIGNRRLPLAPRLLAAAGLLIPLTPLVGPLYHRVNLLFLTGGVWLVALELQGISPERSRTFVKWLGGLFALASTAWLLAGLAVLFAKPRLETYLRSAIEARAEESQFGIFREWMGDRAIRWLDHLPLWSPSSLFPWFLAAAGLTCLWLWRSRWSAAAQWGLALVVLCEVTLSASRWVTFSDPAIFPPYPEIPVISWMKSQVGEGRVSLPAGSVSSRPFPPNTLIPYSIPTLQGYESIHPRFSMGERPSEAMTAVENEEAAVSLAILPGDSPVDYLGWRKTESPEGIPFLVPPMAPSRYLAETPSGPRPCQIISESPNRRVIVPPEGSRRIFFRENWDAGWKAISAGDEAHEMGRRPEGGMTVLLPGSTKIERLELRFEPVWYRQGWRVSLFSLCLLLGIAAAFIRDRTVKIETIEQ